MSKKYGVILADPPWQYDRVTPNGSAENHYSVMTDKDIADLPVASMAMDDCVLIMWATWPKLNEACLPVMKAWGFDYITGFPWVKLAQPVTPSLFGDVYIEPNWGIGWWVRGCTEPILIGRRGKPKLPDTDYAGVLCELMTHSRKPSSIHNYAESLQGPYLELFARRPREGWDIWGNEIDSDITL